MVARAIPVTVSASEPTISSQKPPCGTACASMNESPSGPQPSLSEPWALATRRSPIRKISSATPPQAATAIAAGLEPVKIAITSAPIANTASTISALPCRSAPPWAHSGSAPGGVKSKTVMSSDANRHTAAAITASGSSRVARESSTSFKCRPPGPCPCRDRARPCAGPAGGA